LSYNDVVEAVVAGLSDRIKSASVAFVVGRGKVEEPAVVKIKLFDENSLTNK
jgi:hypothetical protein